MTLIGMAEYSPAIPTSGAEIAPRTNGSNPRRADALPAICACFSIASANDDVEIIPTDETKKKMGMITATSGPLKSTTINKMILDTHDIINPIFKKRVSETVSAKRPTTCVPNMIPIPFILNNRLNNCGDAP